MARESNQHLQWLAGLANKRLVAIHELPERGAWQSDSLNQLVSGGAVEANRMRQDSFNFNSVSHVIATGNHRPRAAAGSGIWRRLRIVQFQHQPAEPNTTLKAELLAELPGVFAWMLKGLHDWIANGRKLDTPNVLRQETEAYRSDADPVKQFADECLTLDPALTSTVPMIYDAFFANVVD